MTLQERITNARSLTPTEEQLVQTICTMGDRLQSYTVKELARLTSTSIASINRLCKKLGYTGYKELKIEVIRDHVPSLEALPIIDVNFPFAPGDTRHDIIENMSSLYATTITETAKLLDNTQLDHAARYIDQAESVDIYTGSHNIYPAQMFTERLLSAGKHALCPVGLEQHARLAIASNERHCAILITYSGLGTNYKLVSRLLAERSTPIILIGSQRARRRLPNLNAYLLVSDRENLQNRITQFASHIAVQFVLDTLYCCFFNRNYAHNMDFLQHSLPYTSPRVRYKDFVQ